MSAKTTSLAYAANRVADALFTIAKAQKAGVKAQEGLLETQREMLEMQRQNMATTKALEHALLMDRAEHGNG